MGFKMCTPLASILSRLQSFRNKYFSFHRSYQMLKKCHNIILNYMYLSSSSKPHDHYDHLHAALIQERFFKDNP